MPPPKAVSAAVMPTAPRTRSGGNSSRMMPKEIGSTPPPRPWITRATIISEIECERPASTEPPVSASSVTMSIRSLPTMSPMRPRIGVATEADSR